MTPTRRRRALAAAGVLAAVAVPVQPAGATFSDPAAATASFTAAVLAPPTNLTLGLCVTGFTANWTATTSTWRTGYEVQWKKSTSGTWTNSATTNDTSHAISGLSLLTTYNVRVRAYFGANWKSTFAGPVSVFCTL